MLLLHMIFFLSPSSSHSLVYLCIIFTLCGSPGFIDAQAEIQMHTDCALLSGGLQGNRAERKLRAFARQGLSGVMATGADYPTLHQLGREERKEG